MLHAVNNHRAERMILTFSFTIEGNSLFLVAAVVNINNRTNNEYIAVEK